MSANGGRERAYKELRESEELHRATLSSISDAVFLTDDHGRFTFVCPNADVIFGYTPDEVRSFGRIGRLLGDGLFDRAELGARGEIRNIEREIEVKSGERRTVLIHVKSVAIQGGTVLYTCRDVTELKHAEEQVRVMRAELAHASRLVLVGELMASIAHEVKQPLTAIVGNASVGLSVLTRASSRGGVVELQEIFNDIVEEGRLAADVIDRLRALARKRPLVLRPLDLNELVTDTLRFVRGDAQRRHVALRAELEPALPPIQADRVCLQQVLLSLCMNAMEAMDDRDPADRRLFFGTRRCDGSIELTVKDSGHGIAGEHLPRLFEPFFSTKRDGVGLGLAISQSIVDEHHGLIWAEDNAGRGATFYLRLPSNPSG